MKRVSWRGGAAASLTAVLLLAGGVGLGLAHDDDLDSGRGWLGVFLGRADDGVRIMSVMPGSPADEAGIESGDVVVAIDGRAVSDTKEFMGAFRALAPGDRPVLTVQRDGDELTVDPVLEEKSDRFVVEMPHFNFKVGDGDHGNHIFETQQRGYLGVHLQGLTDELREYFGAPDSSGVLVARVEEDSPAQRAGLQVGDVITAIDGEAVKHHGDLLAGLEGLEEGDAVEIEAVRDGRLQSFQVNVDVKEANTFSWHVNCDDDADGGEGCEKMEFLPHGALDGVFRFFGDPESRRHLEDRLHELEERMERMRPERSTSSDTRS